MVGVTAKKWAYWYIFTDKYFVCVIRFYSQTTKWFAEMK